MDNNQEAVTIQTTSQSASLASTPNTQAGWMSMVPIVLIFFVMYFLLIRPQDKKRKQHEEMLKSVKKGEAVITIGGVYGVITKVDDKEGVVFVEIAKDVQIKMLRSAIAELPNRKSNSTNLK